MGDLFATIDKLTPQHLAAICVFVGFFLIVFFATPERGGLGIKFAGSAFVLALTFGANQTGTYALGMVIVATLVTELEFIEKIFAIFWRSDSYFRWRIDSASPGQIIAKKLDEVAEDAGTAASPPALATEPATSGTGDEKLPQGRTAAPVAVDAPLQGYREQEPIGERSTLGSASKSKQFEDEVFTAIAKGASPFSQFGSTSRNLSVRGPGELGKRDVLVDIVHRVGNVHAIIEVRNSIVITTGALKSLRAAVAAYSAFQAEANSKPQRIVPILILRAMEGQSHPRIGGISVLTFDGNNMASQFGPPSELVRLENLFFLAQQ